MLAVAPEAKVKVPVLVISKGPLPVVVVTGLLNVKPVPVRLIPETVVVVSAPLKVVTPVPAD